PNTRTAGTPTNPAPGTPPTQGGGGGEGGGTVHGKRRVRGTDLRQPPWKTPRSTPGARPSTFSRHELVLSEFCPTVSVLAGFRRDSQSHVEGLGLDESSRSFLRRARFVLQNAGIAG